MHIFILTLSSLFIAPIFIALVLVINYFRNRWKGVSILDVYWVSGFISIVLSGICSYILWVFNGEIPGLENTALKAAGISAIVCFVYLLILRTLLFLFRIIRNFFSKNQ